MISSSPQANSTMSEMEGVVHGIVRRLHLGWLDRHHNHRLVLAIYGFLCCFISFGLIATLGKWTQSLALIPSLGSTAFLLFYTPLAPSAAPRNIVLGQIIALSAGYVSVVAMHIVPGEALLHGAISWQEVVASALALALTSGGMILFDAPHPPAAATTLIVALGTLRQPMQILGLLAGVVILIAIAFGLNRFAGVPYPLWATRRQDRTT